MSKSARSAIRRSLKKWLPRPILRVVRGRYYAHWLIPRLSEDSEPDLAVVRAFLQPGDTAIDAGANFGRYSLVMAAAVGPNGEVLAIEPVPETFDHLKTVLAYSGTSNVTALNMAVSDATGVVQMQVPDMDGELNYFRASIDRRESDGRTIEAEAGTLDELSARLSNPPVFVKMDLEGHEITALDGAEKLLDNGVAWLLEHPLDPVEADRLTKRMKEAGYSAWMFDDTEKLLRPSSPGDDPVNLFYFSEVHLKRFESSPITVLID